MRERHKALLWRIPLLTAIIYTIAQRFVPNMQNRAAIGLFLVLYVFNLVITKIVVDDIKFQDWLENTGYLMGGIFVSFSIATSVGTIISILVVSRLTHSLFWSLLFVALIPYVVVAIFLIFYLAFACDKK